jgi:hypothetical protein
LEADHGEQRERLGEIVAESVARMGTGAVGFVEIGTGTARSVESPGDLVEIANEFVATRVDEEPAIADGVAQTAIDTIDAITNGWVGGSSPDGSLIDANPAREEFGE